MIKAMRYIRNSARNAIVASVMVGVFSAAYADPQIEAVSSSIQGGVDVVRIDFSEPLKTVPAGFAVQSPARIALDFPGVGNGMGRTNVGINQGNVKGVNVVQANDRTRVVLNLKRATPYKSVIDGNSLLVSEARFFLKAEIQVWLH